MNEQIPLSADANADLSETNAGSAHLHATTDDLAYQRLAIVNAIFFGAPGSARWTLIDTGVPGSARFIISSAESRYGKDAVPKQGKYVSAPTHADDGSAYVAPR
jgi:hypothetical protein